MNNLSWLIYLADLFSSMGVLFTVLGIGTCMGLFITVLVCLTNNKSLPSRLPMMVCVGVGFLFVSAVLPSKDTMYAIMVSELGEEVLNSEIGGKTQQALQAWLDKQIETATSSEEEAE